MSPVKLSAASGFGSASLSFSFFKYSVAPRYATITIMNKTTLLQLIHNGHITVFTDQYLLRTAIIAMLNNNTTSTNDE